MNHGIFTFGESARESYELMIELVAMAEDYPREAGSVGADTVATTERRGAGIAMRSPRCGTPFPTRPACR